MRRAAGLGAHVPVIFQGAGDHSTTIVRRKGMKIFSRDFGQLRGGEVIQVTLQGAAANVRLVDSFNFSAFKAGRNHHYYGGHVAKSPVQLRVPHAGHWYVTLDFGGYSGSTRWRAEILPGPLPPLREAPLASVPSLVHEPAGSSEQRTYDVFVSHASEDKNGVVRPLVHALKNAGLDVWFDEFELKIGKSLRRTIDRGLANSRFGLVILSQAFFGKGWTNYELDGLVTRAVTGEQVILPIWHNVSKEEVQRYSPSLADTVARSTTNFTIEEIAADVADVILTAKGQA